MKGTALFFRIPMIPVIFMVYHNDHFEWNTGVSPLPGLSVGFPIVTAALLAGPAAVAGPFLVINLSPRSPKLPSVLQFPIQLASRKLTGDGAAKNPNYLPALCHSVVHRNGDEKRETAFKE